MTPSAYRNSEIDACGVRGIGSVMTARERSVATLASHAFELTTTSLVLDLAISGNKKKTTLLGGFSFYRNSEIRTHDLLLPKQALYQAELYSGSVVQ